MAKYFKISVISIDVSKMIVSQLMFMFTQNITRNMFSKVRVEENPATYTNLMF